MFCKFQYFPMVKFSCVQSPFTKPTVVAIKRTKENKTTEQATKQLAFKCSNESQ